MKEEFEKLGIIFTDTDSALKEYPDLFKQYFAKLVPPTDNKLAALNSTVWSGGTFIYVPKGVKVDVPLQTYFHINNENTGQFERTLIIVDEGASVHYVEGCTAPTYSSNSHAAIVEIFAWMVLTCAIRPSKLVRQCLQLGHQAGQGSKECHSWVDRRKPRCQDNYEVSICLSGWRRSVGPCCPLPLVQGNTKIQVPRWFIMPLIPAHLSYRNLLRRVAEGRLPWTSNLQQNSRNQFLTSGVTPLLWMIYLHRIQFHLMKSTTHKLLWSTS